MLFVVALLDPIVIVAGLAIGLLTKSWKSRLAIGAVALVLLSVVAASIDPYESGRLENGVFRAFALAVWLGLGAAGRKLRRPKSST